MKMTDQLHVPAALLPGETPNTHKMEDRLGPNAGERKRFLSLKGFESQTTQQLI
jgi:hypothetical protein